MVSSPQQALGIAVPAVCHPSPEMFRVATLSLPLSPGSECVPGDLCRALQWGQQGAAPPPQSRWRWWFQIPAQRSQEERKSSVHGACEDCALGILFVSWL